MSHLKFTSLAHQQKRLNIFVCHHHREERLWQDVVDFKGLDFYLKTQQT